MSLALFITAKEYKQEVNQAGAGVWVVVLLYKSECVKGRKRRRRVKKRRGRKEGDKTRRRLKRRWGEE